MDEIIQYQIEENNSDIPNNFFICNGVTGHKFNQINRYKISHRGDYICEYCWTTKFLVDPVLNQEKYISKFTFSPKETEYDDYPLITCGFSIFQNNPDYYILEISNNTKTTRSGK